MNKHIVETVADWQELTFENCQRVHSRAYLHGDMDSRTASILKANIKDILEKSSVPILDRFLFHVGTHNPVPSIQDKKISKKPATYLGRCYYPTTASGNIEVHKKVLYGKVSNDDATVVDYLILLNSGHLDKQPLMTVLDTLLHEIAHAINFSDNPHAAVYRSHGREFKQICRQLGIADSTAKSVLINQYTVEEAYELGYTYGKYAEDGVHLSHTWRRKPKDMRGVVSLDAIMDAEFDAYFA